LSNSYAVSYDDLESIRRIAETHGFCLVKGVFSPAQMSALGRDIAADHAAFDGRMPDIMTCPSLRWVALHRNVLAVARALMPGALVYYGESHIDYETQVGPRTLSPFSQLHIDARGTPESLDPFWSSPSDAIFRGYRFAVYLQDYSRSSGGLMVGVGSHRGDLSLYGIGGPAKVDFKFLKFGEKAFKVGWPDMPLHIIPSQPGDLVVWNLRTLHSAGARRLAARPDMALLPIFEKEIFEALPEAFLPSPGPRNALFFDYGTPTEEVDLYIKHRSLKLTPARLEETANWHYDSDAVQAALEAEDIQCRFDPILVPLCARIASTGENPAPSLESLRDRLCALAARHAEFSPYFPLLSPTRFAERAAQDRAEAVRYAVGAVMERVAAAGLA
jgi:ectoine hydroxylase-related dioxygenase (phytanoyl-CoA dioxygenase family)